MVSVPLGASSSCFERVAMASLVLAGFGVVVDEGGRRAFVCVWSLDVARAKSGPRAFEKHAAAGFRLLDRCARATPASQLVAIAVPMLT
jgi:hypothetical protein